MPPPGHFTTENDPLYRRLGGPQDQSGWVWKMSPWPGFDAWTIQPVVSFYTDCTISCPTKQYVVSCANRVSSRKMLKNSKVVYKGYIITTFFTLHYILWRATWDYNSTFFMHKTAWSAWSNQTDIYRVIKKSLCTWRLQYKKHAKIQYFKQFQSPTMIT